MYNLQLLVIQIMNASLKLKCIIRWKECAAGAIGVELQVGSVRSV